MSDVKRFLAPTNDTCDMNSYQYVVLATDYDALAAENERLHITFDDMCRKAAYWADKADELERDAARWRKCKTMPKEWWIEAMAEASRKGGRGLDEALDTALSKN